MFVCYITYLRPTNENYMTSQGRFCFRRLYFGSLHLLPLEACRPLWAAKVRQPITFTYIICLYIKSSRLVGMYVPSFTIFMCGNYDIFITTVYICLSAARHVLYNMNRTQLWIQLNYLLRLFWFWFYPVPAAADSAAAAAAPPASSPTPSLATEHRFLAITRERFIVLDSGGQGVNSRAVVKSNNHLTEVRD